MAADWIQGPYVYALYSHYGFSKQHIARLYIVGFASSALFGTVIASVADKYGRKRNALLYCVVYALSCATKHSPDFHVLLLGRVLGGIAYSILFSAFESWMVYEHHARGFSEPLLATTFARAQLGNGVVAIISGLVAGYVAKKYSKVAPFDLSMAVLALLAAVLSATWRENYGDAAQSVRGGFGKAVRTLVADRKIILLGVAQAAFEGALYTFTFVWTPALQDSSTRALSTAALAVEEATPEIPHGIVFASFMACTMIGSNVFSLATSLVSSSSSSSLSIGSSSSYNNSKYSVPLPIFVLVPQLVSFFRRRMLTSVESLMAAVFCMGTVLFAVITVWHTLTPLVLAAFLGFEVLCGMYFPGMATARAPYIPEESRSAILTFFRIPLNLVVVFALYRDMQVRSVFALCAVLMAVGALSMGWLARLATTERRKQNKKEKHGSLAGGMGKTDHTGKGPVSESGCANDGNIVDRRYPGTAMINNLHHIDNQDNLKGSAIIRIAKGTQHEQNIQDQRDQDMDRCAHVSSDGVSVPLMTNGHGLNGHGGGVGGSHENRWENGKAENC